MNKSCGHLAGTYSCMLPEGHAGKHQRTDYKRNSSNVITAWVTASWTDAYSEVRFKHVANI